MTCWEKWSASLVHHAPYPFWIPRFPVPEPAFEDQFWKSTGWGCTNPFLQNENHFRRKRSLTGLWLQRRCLEEPYFTCQRKRWEAVLQLVYHVIQICPSQCKTNFVCRSPSSSKAAFVGLFFLYDISRCYPIIWKSPLYEWDLQRNGILYFCNSQPCGLAEGYITATMKDRRNNSIASS